MMRSYFAQQVALESEGKNESLVAEPLTQEYSSLMVFFTAKDGNVSLAGIAQPSGATCGDSWPWLT